MTNSSVFREVRTLHRPSWSLVNSFVERGKIERIWMSEFSSYALYSLIKKKQIHLLSNQKLYRNVVYSHKIWAFCSFPELYKYSSPLSSVCRTSFPFSAEKPVNSELHFLIPRNCQQWACLLSLWICLFWHLVWIGLNSMSRASHLVWCDGDLLVWQACQWFLCPCSHNIPP